METSLARQACQLSGSGDSSAENHSAGEFRHPRIPDEHRRAYISSQSRGCRTVSGPEYDALSANNLPGRRLSIAPTNKDFYLLNGGLHTFPHVLAPLVRASPTTDT